MSVLTGMEKFSHLEDKIYLTIEYAKKMRDEKERLERESDGLKRETAEAVADRRLMEEKLAALTTERDLILEKVEAMLAALAQLDAAESSVAAGIS
jgi:chromosome segregation ATPase